jgi:hypothetical protein
MIAAARSRGTDGSPPAGARLTDTVPAAGAVLRRPQAPEGTR